ncbi:MAG: hypothetical protein ACLQVD_11125 [Capsulimonadaceae bacterium]
MSRKTHRRPRATEVPESRPQAVEAPRVGDVDPGVAAGGTAFVVLVAIILCLMPKMGHDLFWQLRTGLDILRTGQPPHTDRYSWTEFGRRWVVPEWLAFAAYAAAFRVAGLFGTWLVLVVLTVSTALVLWFDLVKRVRPVPALVLICLALGAMSILLQERPYGFTYLLLAISLSIVMRVREERAGPVILLLLPPLCILWANLHQGVLILPVLLFTFAVGDLVTAMVRPKGRPEMLSRAGWMGGVAIMCAAAATVSPYGWRTYGNILVTLRDPRATMVVTEWHPVTTFTADVTWQFILLASVLAAGYVCSRRPRDPGGALCVLGLLLEAILHIRNVAPFAIGGIMIIGPQAISAAERINIPPLLPRPIVFAVVYIALIGWTSARDLARSIGPRGYSPAGIGEAAVRLSSFPVSMFDFMQAEHFPPGLRIYNNYDVGSYMIYRMPSEPVFIDGREDVYVGLSRMDSPLRVGIDNPRPGMTLQDCQAISDAQQPADVADLLQQYDFDCVVTTAGLQAMPFVRDRANWAIVYVESMPKVPPPGKGRGWIFLRNRPQFQDLIARCRRDCSLAQRY